MLNYRKAVLAAIVILAFGMATVGIVLASETKQELTRAVYSYFKAEVAKVGDVQGHIVGIAEGRGLSFLDSGEVGDYSVQAMFDYVNGSGPHQGYVTTTFEDGSTTVVKVEGTTTAIKGGKVSLFECTYTYIKGTGRYKGIEGGGSYSETRVTPMAAGAFCHSESTGTYALP